MRGGLEQIDSAFADLDSARAVPAGKLRITLPRIVAERRVLPALPSFLARYPQVDVELCVEPALTDLVAEGFDAGIRLGESLARGMIAVPIGPPERQVVVATPGYFAQYGIPASPHELQGHACIVHRRANGRLMPWEFSRDDHDLEVEVNGRLVFNDAELAHGAVLAGLGMAQGSRHWWPMTWHPGACRRAAGLAAVPRLPPDRNMARSAGVHRPSARRTARRRAQAGRRSVEPAQPFSRRMPNHQEQPATRRSASRSRCARIDDTAGAMPGSPAGEGGDALVRLRIDEQRQERHVEQDRLRVEQADQDRLLEVAARLHADRAGITALVLRRAQQADADPHR